MLAVWLKRFARLSLGLVLLIVFFGAYVWWTRDGSTPPFTNEPRSIASREYVELGGLAQNLLIRSRNVENPVLLRLHGGPGFPQTTFGRYYNSELEDHFTVVYWEQRGAGRSFRPDIDPATMTLEQFLLDLDQLVDHLRARFNQEKIFILGHSWGSVLGINYAHQHPEKLFAYIGAGQVSDMPLSEEKAYTWLLDQAKARGNKAALSSLEDLGPPPHSLDQILIQRQWLMEFGGASHQPRSMWSMLQVHLATDEGTLWDLVRMFRGSRFTLELMQEPLSHMQPRDLRDFAVPIIFLLGRYDMQTNSEIAAEHFAEIRAPFKKLYWFEESAHLVPYEEPDKLLRILVEQLRPLQQAKL